MDITYNGLSSFKIKGRGATIITDPFSPDVVGLKFPKLSADIVTISHDHDDHNRADLVEEAKKVISGPGEYEIGGVSIIGFPSFHDDKKGAVRGKNTIYVYEIDGLRVAHLGDLGYILSEAEIERLGDINILFIPVGGDSTVNASQAAEIVRAIEPNVVIPMHYKVKGMNEKVFSKLTGVEIFLSEVGLPQEATDKYSVKAFLAEEQKSVILEKK